MMKKLRMNVQKNNEILVKLTSAISIFVFLVMTTLVQAQSENELKGKIDDHGEKIKQLDEEIKIFEKQISEKQTEAKSLENTIKTLDINQKKISTEINKAELSINKTNKNIGELNTEIISLEQKIRNSKEAVALIIRDLQQEDGISMIEKMLANKSLAEIFDTYKSNIDIQEKISKQAVLLTSQKSEVEVKKTSKETEKLKLVSLKEELGDKKVILDNNKKEKDSLLVTTKSQEAAYKAIVQEKQRQKEEFEKQLFEYESQLKRIVDPSSYQKAKEGIFVWPLDNITITQPFGITSDSKRLYASGSHNGVDFRASRGTPVKSISDGFIKAVGNTDSQKGCYSYGKWVLIEHLNGLSSLYAHLDLIKVVANQEVNAGSIIGYSGQTGYATGPHLHLTLYATQGVSVEKYSFSKNCKNVSIPIADKSAYLDPIPYFNKSE